MDFTLLHHNSTRSGKIYMEFSIGTHFPLAEDIKNSYTGNLNCHPITPGNLPINHWGFVNCRLRTPGLDNAQSFRGYIFSTQHSLHSLHRRDCDEQKTVVVMLTSLPGLQKM